jgi:transposase
MTASLWPRIMGRRNKIHGETTEAEPHVRVQGEGGFGSPSRHQDVGRAVDADVHPNQITTWKAQMLEGVFGAELSASAPSTDLKDLHATIGQQALEIDFLVGALGKAGLPSAKR